MAQATSKVRDQLTSPFDAGRGHQLRDWHELRRRGAGRSQGGGSFGMPAELGQMQRRALAGPDAGQCIHIGAMIDQMVNKASVTALRRDMQRGERVTRPASVCIGTTPEQYKRNCCVASRGCGMQRCAKCACGNIDVGTSVDQQRRYVIMPAEDSPMKRGPESCASIEINTLVNELASQLDVAHFGGILKWPGESRAHDSQRQHYSGNTARTLRDYPDNIVADVEALRHRVSSRQFIGR